MSCDLVVVSNRHNLQVMEEREQDDVKSLETEVKENGQGGQEEHHLHCNADAINHVRLQPLKDTSRDLDGCVDWRKTVSCQDYVTSRFRSVSGSVHRNANLCLEATRFLQVLIQLATETTL